MLKKILAILLACAPLFAQDFLRDVEIGPQRFEVVEIARTPEQKAQGLQGRKFLPDTSAMLFLSETPAPVIFWMKGTLIPLDAIFFDAAGRILSVQTMAVEPPKKLLETESAYERRLKRYSCLAPVFAVLEIRAGLAAELGLKTGDVVPALAAQTLLPQLP